MFQRDDLVGLTLSGFFHRDSELIRASEEFDAGRFKDDPTGLARRQETNAVNNRTYTFNVWVLEYDPTSGLFIAQGKDVFGDSGLVGTIEGTKIEFTKLYRGRVKLPEELGRLDVSRFTEIKYDGTIHKPDGTISSFGVYQPGQAQNYRGRWQLDAQPR
ncbi:MAG: hypothetical protein Q7R76_02245 [Candidatus Woesearchaeota archaeon]|nr:hypothetical protein [Candidatus Woesearchaeota archaeon]